MAKYYWRCPSCGTRLELRQRVTLTKRKCPHCATPITPEAIDYETNLSKEDRQEIEFRERRAKGLV